MSYEAIRLSPGTECIKLEFQSWMTVCKLYRRVCKYVADTHAFDSEVQNGHVFRILEQILKKLLLYSNKLLLT